MGDGRVAAEQAAHCGLHLARGDVHNCMRCGKRGHVDSQNLARRSSVAIHGDGRAHRSGLPLSTYSLDSSTSLTMELLSTLIKLCRLSAARDAGFNQRSSDNSGEQAEATAANTHAWRD